jgi:hypothetical protein
LQKNKGVVLCEYMTRTRDEMLYLNGYQTAMKDVGVIILGIAGMALVANIIRAVVS